MTVTRWDGVDYDLVTQLRNEVGAALREERQRRGESGASLSGEEEREYGWALVRRTLDRHRTNRLGRADGLGDPETDAPVAAAVHAELFGAGRLQPLLDDPEVVNVDVSGADHVRITLTDGRVVDGPPVARSDDDLIDLVRRLATYGGLSSRAFDHAHPWVEMRLPGGSRLCALMAVCERPAVSIRCFRSERVDLDELHARGGFNEQVGTFLEACVRARMNLMVSGETFAGKTTLLRALGNAIPANERLVTVEHFRELGFGLFPELHHDVVELEERPPNAEGAGAKSMADLVEHARRLNPDRLIVGEVIGGEVIAMLDAMTQGEDGSLSTIHSRSSSMVFQRIATYALRAGMPVEASMHLTGGGLDFVVHLAKRTLPDGKVRRYVASVREVVGCDGTQVISSEVFAETPGWTQVAAAPISLARSLRLAEIGYDQSRWAR